FVREWNRFYDRIDDHLTGQAAQDARRVLRKHLLSEDARIRDSAARTLQRSQDGRRARRPDDELAADATDPKTPHDAAYEKGVTDAVLDTCLKKIMRERGWTPPANSSGAVPPPGASGSE